MKWERFHAGGEADYEKAMEPRREREVFRRRGRLQAGGTALPRKRSDARLANPACLGKDQRPVSKEVTGHRRQVADPMVACVTKRNFRCRDLPWQMP